jgi:hypothetical protein
MLTCANHSCHKRAKYLHKGKLFVFEQRATGTKVEHRWLCQTCARRWKVVWKHSHAELKPIAKAHGAQRAA